MPTEKRAAARFYVSTPVKLTWVAVQGIETLEGITKDISIRSLFVWSNKLPPTGATVQCRVYLPGRTAASPPVRFDLTGPVIRTEAPSADHHLFGFVILSPKELDVVFSS